jgi:hypothetical protein
MARTLVGQLILKLVDQMSGPAKGAAQSLNQVTAAAKGLNGAGAAGAAGMDRLAKSMKDVNDRANAANIRGWSLSFEKTLARLKVSAEEMQLVKASWNDLQNAFAREKISGSLKSIRIAEWRNATVAHLMGVRTALDQTGAAAANMGSRTANELCA